MQPGTRISIGINKVLSYLILSYLTARTRPQELALRVADTGSGSRVGRAQLEPGEKRRGRGKKRPTSDRPTDEEEERAAR